VNTIRIHPLPFLLLFGLVVGLFAAPLQAQRNKKIEVGSDAPPAVFEGAKLISGAEPTSFEEGKTYVIEFWATWCAPCRKSIPHLNELSKSLKRKGVTVIGISDEKPDVVASFVRKKGDGMSYTVIADPDGKYKKAWMQAAGAKGIPTAFIVGPTGRIVYIGHPMEDSFERILRLCSDGKYDPTLYDQAQPLLVGVEQSIKVRDWGMAHRQLDKAIEIDPWVFSHLMQRKYKLMLIEEGRVEDANVYLASQIDVYFDKPDVLADIALMTSSDPDLPAPNMELAHSAIVALTMAKGEKNPEVLAVVAIVAYKQGDLDGAVRNQFQAWMAADPDVKSDYKTTLDRYKSEQNAKRGGSRKQRAGRR
jgi:thiol-disulfide isomerase/thioredoxin